MGSKGHFWVSMAKSVIRIAACVVLIFSGNFVVGGTGFLVAEVLGVVEELVDGR